MRARTNGPQNIQKHRNNTPKKGGKTRTIFPAPIYKYKKQNFLVGTFRHDFIPTIEIRLSMNLNNCERIGVVV